MRVAFHRLAAEDPEAVQFYSGRDPALGRRLLEELRKVVDRLRWLPFSAPEHDCDVRRALLPTFPYQVLYRVEQRRLFILAVAHTSRRPGYWRDRS